MESNEVSIQEARFFVALQKSKGQWMTHKQLAADSKIAERTARAYTKKLVRLGILDVAELSPAHRYRISDKAARRNASYVQRLQTAVEIFGIS